MTNFEKLLGTVDYEEAMRSAQEGSRHKFFAWVGLHSEMEHSYYEDALETLGLTDHIVPNHHAGEFYCEYDTKNINELQSELNHVCRTVERAGYPVSFLASGTAMILGNAAELKLPCRLITPQTAAANYCNEHGIKRVGAIYSGMQYDGAQHGTAREETFFRHGLMANGAVELVTPTDNDFREPLGAALLRSDSSLKSGHNFLTRTIVMLLEKFLREYGEDERMPRELVVANAELSRLLPRLLRDYQVIHKVIVERHLKIIDAVALQLQEIIKELI